MPVYDNKFGMQNISASSSSPVSVDVSPTAPTSANVIEASLDAGMRKGIEQYLSGKVSDDDLKAIGADPISFFEAGVLNGQLKAATMRASSDISKRSAEIYEAHKANPSAFRDALSEWGKTYVDELPPQIRASALVDLEKTSMMLASRVAENYASVQADRSSAEYGRMFDTLIAMREKAGIDGDELGVRSSDSEIASLLEEVRIFIPDRFAKIEDSVRRSVDLASSLAPARRDLKKLYESFDPNTASREGIDELIGRASIIANGAAVPSWMTSDEATQARAQMLQSFSLKLNSMKAEFDIQLSQRMRSANEAEASSLSGLSDPAYVSMLIDSGYTGLRYGEEVKERLASAYGSDVVSPEIVNRISNAFDSAASEMITSGQKLIDLNNNLSVMSRGQYVTNWNQEFLNKQFSGFAWNAPENHKMIGSFLKYSSSIPSSLADYLNSIALSSPEVLRGADLQGVLSQIWTSGLSNSIVGSRNEGKLEKDSYDILVMAMHSSAPSYADAIINSRTLLEKESKMTQQEKSGRDTAIQASVDSMREFAADEVSWGTGIWDMITGLGLHAQDAIAAGFSYIPENPISPLLTKLFGLEQEKAGFDILNESMRIPSVKRQNAYELRSAARSAHPIGGLLFDFYFSAPYDASFEGEYSEAMRLYLNATGRTEPDSSDMQTVMRDVVKRGGYGPSAFGGGAALVKYPAELHSGLDADYTRADVVLTAYRQIADNPAVLAKLSGYLTSLSDGDEDYRQRAAYFASNGVGLQYKSTTPGGRKTYRMFVVLSDGTEQTIMNSYTPFIDPNTGEDRIPSISKASARIPDFFGRASDFIVGTIIGSEKRPDWDAEIAESLGEIYGKDIPERLLKW